ncbi:hypothetical protein [Turneriella parva]|uniref:Uncharacterized protein n=1 Tax=Turneriella parva (strain ATCC BAA-1111 / DSM 21527 / NCTC 11395 / H) TaxID=869212 RepID=I4B5I4_TURPD|nr:hypothetical protein [Turneriella parva]AFM12541.1 hypothetical protein Turpa_1894 [Turneriella parva DSM 21527]
MRAQRLISILLFSSVSLSPLLAAKRKLLILPFQNREKNALYDYLEGSITDAVTRKLQENFIFESPAEEKWKGTASQNLVHQHEFYTHTAGMQLGAWLKQDVVISGSYIVVQKPITRARQNYSDEKPADRPIDKLVNTPQTSAPVIVTTVRVFDISKKKLVTEFDVESFADASLFESIDALAVRVAKEAAVVLPNETEWRETRASEFADYQHHVGLSVSVGAISTPAALDTAIGSGSQLLPKDFHPLKFSIGYTRRQTFYRDIFVTGQLTYGAASSSFAVERSTSDISASSRLLSVSAGAGYHWAFWSRYYAAPVLRVGYQSGNITLSYENLLTKPVDLDGQEVTKRTFTANAPLIGFGAFGGYRMNETLAAEFHTEYELLFFSNRVSAQVFFGLAMTMGLEL